PTPQPGGGTSGAPPKATGAGYRITAERIVVENGTVSLTDARAKREIRLEQIALTASLKGMPAPASLDGSMMANGVRLAVEMRLAAPDATRQPIEATIKTDGGELRLAGAIEDLGKAPRYAGTLKLSAADFAGFVAGLMRAAGAPPADLPPALARKVAYEGGLDASATGIVARDFKLDLGDESGSGSLSVTFTPLKVDGKLAFTRLDLDKWLAGAPAKTTTAPAPAKPAAKAGGVPSDLALKLDLRAADVVYGGKSVKDVAVDVELAQGSLTLHKLAAVLPGGARLDASSTAQGKAYRGTVSLAGENLRELLGWLKVDVASAPQGKLGAFSFKGNLGGSGLDTLAISDATVQLDGTTLKGALSVALKATPSFTLDLQADALDLDAWLPRRTAAAPPSAKGAAPQAASSPADLSGIDARVKAKIARLTYGGERIEGVDADITLRGGRLTIGDTRIAAIAGGSLALKGSVANLGASPAFDLNIGAQNVNLERLAKLAQQPPFTKAPVGAVSVQGAIAGTPNDLTMRNLQVSALGSHLGLTGKLALAQGGPRYDFSAFSLRTDNLGRLFAAIGQEPPGVTGDISATGALQGDPKTVSYRGNFALKGIQAQGSVRVDIAAVPRVAADLRVGDLDIDKLFGGSTAGPAAGPAGGERYSRAPIDLSPLKALEGQFKLVAATLQKGVWRLEKAQLEATLKGGVLSITRLNGGFYGGTLDLSGKVDAARAPGHLDARVTAANVNLGRFGPALVDSDRIGGAMNANIAFNASLASVHGLVGTLHADGKIHGTVRFNVTNAERVAGQAVGAVGGVVTKGAAGVLREITGPLGGVARGASGTVEGLGLALRIAMDRFVGRNAPMAGEITVRGGTLSTNNTRVDGERAWAMVVANVNLPAWTQDTTINVFVQEDPTRPAVVVRQTGSVDHPNRAITTSGAGAPQQQQPQQPQPQQPAPSTAPQKPKTVPGAVRDLLKGLGR
ncbi:MAG: AsmA-like C-terminal region-containing protein, partial [Reyranellaceae bacterium]